MRTVKTSLVLILSFLLSFSVYAKHSHTTKQELYLGSPYIHNPLGEG